MTSEAGKNITKTQMEVMSSSDLPHMACSEVRSKFERGLISAVPLHCLLMVLLLAPAAEKMTIKHDILDTSKTTRRRKKKAYYQTFGASKYLQLVPAKIKPPTLK